MRRGEVRGNSAMLSNCELNLHVAGPFLCAKEGKDLGMVRGFFGLGRH